MKVQVLLPKIFNFSFTYNHDPKENYKTGDIVEVPFGSKTEIGVIWDGESLVDKKISIATVYRTLKLFEESGIIERHDFREGKSRYEPSTDQHHDHLIDINSGEIIEFVDKDIEDLQIKIAKKLGYNLVDHKLELYGSKKK